MDIDTTRAKWVICNGQWAMSNEQCAVEYWASLSGGFIAFATGLINRIL